MYKHKCLYVCIVCMYICTQTHICVLVRTCCICPGGDCRGQGYSLGQDVSMFLVMLKLTASTLGFPLHSQTSEKEKLAMFLLTICYSCCVIAPLPPLTVLASPPGGSAVAPPPVFFISHCFFLAAACSTLCSRVIGCRFLRQEAAGLDAWLDFDICCVPSPRPYLEVSVKSGRANFTRCKAAV